MSHDLEEVLAEVATRPPELWRRSLRARVADDDVIRHALIWLRANRDAVEQSRPDLGDERYRLLVLLDRGATASVWQAHDRKLGRDVAIKVFDVDRPALLAEARSASEVVSDHVVRVHDVHDDHDPPYLVMELVGEHDPKGGALVSGTSAAECHPRDLDEAVRWVRDVARGVHDAHLRNVFHRDLKPQNVLITPFSRRAKIADFGLAISSSQPQDLSGGLHVETAQGPVRVVGTPAYMAPEQAAGLPVALDPRNPDERLALVRVDVWGLGAVACALLTGRPPWHTDHDAWELAASGVPPWIGDRTADGRRIPARLRDIVARALAVDPRDRHAQASELADELDAYLERRPTSRDRGLARRAGLWIRRNPRLSVTLAVTTLLVALLIATLASVIRLRDEHARLEVDRARLAGEIAAARGELAQTEHTLRERSTALGDVRRAATDAQADYRAIITAKEQALRDAGRETRALSDELAKIRDERDTAEVARGMYEGFWKRARADTASLANDLTALAAERDRLRGERDRAVEERDLARAARQRAESERDAAEAERARATAIRLRLEVDLAALAAELARRPHEP